MITKPLTAAAYTIAYLADDQIIVKFLITSLNNFDVIIWRTNTCVDGHTTYWYLGEARLFGIYHRGIMWARLWRTRFRRIL